MQPAELQEFLTARFPGLEFQPASNRTCLMVPAERPVEEWLARPITISSQSTPSTALPGPKITVGARANTPATYAKPVGAR